MEQQVVQDTLLRLAKHKGVYGYLVLHPRNGRIFQSDGFEGKKPIMESYAEKITNYAALAHSMVRTLNYEDQLMFLRIRMRMDKGRPPREILIAPDPDTEKRDYIIIVVQDHVTALQKQPLPKGSGVFDRSGAIEEGERERSHFSNAASPNSGDGPAQFGGPSASMAGSGA